MARDAFHRDCRYRGRAFGGGRAPLLRGKALGSEESDGPEEGRRGWRSQRAASKGVGVSEANPHKNRFPFSQKRELDRPAGQPTISGTVTMEAQRRRRRPTVRS